MPKAEKRPLFLETTIFIRRLLGSRADRMGIARNLETRHTLSSTYVLAEYKATLLSAAVDMYNCVVASEDIIDAIGRWNRYRGGKYKRGVNLLLQAICSSAGDKESVLIRLEEFIEVTLPLQFDELIDELIDPTGCQTAHVETRKVSGAYELPINFPPSEAEEGLRDFLLKHFERLVELHDALPEGRKYFRQIKKDLDRLLKKDFALGVRAWQRLSDVVIALEVQKESELYTLNLTHFRVIANVFGVKLYQE